MSEQHTNQNEPFLPQLMDAEELADYLNTNLETGLSSKAAKSRRRRYGRNIIRGELELRFGSSIKNQFKSLTYLFFLILSFVLYLFDPQTIYLVAFFSVPLVLLADAFLETRAASELNRLNQSASLTATVLRDGKGGRLDSRLLVPGDVIYLEENHIVPADCRIIQDDGNLLVLETPVSGAPSAVKKSAYAKATGEETVAENMLYAGTILREGSCYALVCVTGKETLTRRMHRKKEEFLPLLLRQTRNYARLSAIAAAIACFLVIVLGGLFQKWTVSVLFITAAALSAASLCDSILPLSLASFVHHLLLMSEDRLIVRNQDCISKMASVDSIMCTKERMMPPKRISLDSVIVNGKLVRLDGPPDREVAELLLLSLACSDYPKPRRAFDRATFSYLKDACVPMNELTEQWFRMDTSRDSDGEVNAVLALHADHYTMVLKGSPESVMSRCAGFALNGKEYKLSDAAQRKMLSLAEAASRENAYLIAVASGVTAADSLRSPLAEKRLIFKGILAFRTTVEVDIANAVFRCNSAGIETVMSTGDPYYTAASIGKSTGVIRSEGEIISAREIKAQDYGMYVLNAGRYRLFLEPEMEQWHNVLRLRNESGRTVAATGEKTEDLALLHDADIAVVPQSAPDILRESSDVLMKESGLHVLADGITNAKALCFRLRWIRQYAASGFILLLTALAVSVFFGNGPAISLPGILFGGLFSNLAIAVCIAFSSTNRKILNQKVPPFRGTLSPEELLLPLVHGVGGGISVFLVYWLSGSSTASLIAYLLIQFLYACGCLWPESLFLHRRFGSRPLWVLLAVLIALFALLLLPDPVRTALAFDPITWAGLAYASGFAVGWHLLAQTIRLVGGKLRKRGKSGMIEKKNNNIMN